MWFKQRERAASTHSTCAHSTNHTWHFDQHRTISSAMNLKCYHLLFLLFFTYARAGKNRFSSEVQSFFEDSISAATVARTADAKNLFVAFPIDLKPRVIVTNRGHPIQHEPPPPPPPPPPITRPPITRAQGSAMQKTKSRQSLSFSHQRNGQDLFQVPFILQQQPHPMQFSQNQFPDMSIQQFTPRNPTLPSIRIPKQETFMQSDLTDNIQPPQQNLFLVQTPFRNDRPELVVERPKLRRPKTRPTQQPKSAPRFKTTLRPARSKLLQAPKEIVIPLNTFKNKNIFRNTSGLHQPLAKATLSPFVKTPPPTLIRHLDEFFGADQSVHVRTTSKPTKIRSRIPTTIKTIRKALSPGLTVLDVKQSKKFDVTSQEDLEDSEELLVPRQHLGINPQFVDFSSLTTQSATTMKPTITAWKGTPKIRTVVHPPPLSLKTALSKQRVASRYSTTINPLKATSLRGTRRRVVQATTENPDLMIDTSHSFEDVPRVGPRLRTVVKKIAKPTGRTIAVANGRKRFFDKEKESNILVPTAKNTALSKVKEETDVFNTITSTPNILIDKNNKPLLSRPQHTVWEDTSDMTDDSFFKQSNIRRPAKAFKPLPNIQITRKRRPILARKPAINRFDTSEEVVGNKPTTSDEREFEPVIRIPELPRRVTTPIQSQTLETEDDFPENQSYEDEIQEYEDEDYEVEIPPSPPPPTTKRPFKRPTVTRKPGSINPTRKSIWNSLPKLSTRKPEVHTELPQKHFQINKPEKSKSFGNADGNAGIKCHSSYCKLPYCYCGGRNNPGEFLPSETPQMIVLTFDDAVNDLNWPLYQTLFFSGHTNPNGCPIRTTLYVSHEWTDYGKVDTMYAAGHEIASHSISHSDGASFTKQKWHDEIYGQKEILTRYGGVKANDIRGMRAPFLAIGGDKMFSMLHEDNFTYDSSVTILENNPPVWPYTLDYGLPHECAIPPCPTKSYPGLWEIPMVSLTDLNGGHCSMADSCSYSTTADGVYEMLSKNFLRHYETNRAPLGLYYHSSWFLTPHRKEGFLRFFDDLLQQDDVYFITSMQLIEWMRNPTPLSEIKQFVPWQCHGKPRQPTCRHSRECNVSFRGDMRSFRTCGECPSIYPWVGKTNV